MSLRPCTLVSVLPVHLPYATMLIFFQCLQKMRALPEVTDSFGTSYGRTTPPIPRTLVC